MSPSKVLLLLCVFPLLLVARVTHGTPIANDGATQRRAELREALLRRPAPPQEGAVPANSERQLTAEERAELRRQLRAQQKSP